MSIPKKKAAPTTPIGILLKDARRGSIAARTAWLAASEEGSALLALDDKAPQADKLAAHEADAEAFQRLAPPPLDPT